MYVYGTAVYKNIRGLAADLRFSVLVQFQVTCSTVRSM
jgi:hypothetical protein